MDLNLEIEASDDDDTSSASNEYFSTEAEISMNGYFRCYMFTPQKRKYHDIHTFTHDSLRQLTKIHERCKKELKTYKLQLRFKVLFKKEIDETILVEAFFNSKQKIVLTTTNVLRLITALIEELNSKIEDFMQQDSGLTVDEILEMRCCTSKLKFNMGSCCTFILPRKLKFKKGMINLRDIPDNMCFVYSILAVLHHADENNLMNTYRAANYTRQLGELNLSGIPFPMSFSNINRFEEQNSMSVFLNSWDAEEGIFPIYRSEKKAKHVNLFFAHDENKVGHFIGIVDLDRFMGNTNNRHKGKKYYCDKCLCALYTQTKLDSHIPICQEKQQKISMPENDEVGKPPIISFMKYKNKLFNGMVCYADFECILDRTVATTQASNELKTKLVNKHIAWSHCIQPCFRSCEHSEMQYLTPHIHRGNNTVNIFLDKLLEIGEKFQAQYDILQPMLISRNDHEQLLREHNQVCHICEDLIHPCESCSANNQFCAECKHIDHCKGCGVVRGPAHSKCNREYVRARDVIVLLHNATRYDNHLIWHELYQSCKKHNLKIEVLAKNGERYLSFTIQKYVECGVSWKIRFIDSYSFLSASLDMLVHNLLDKGRENFKALMHRFPDPKQHTLLLRKGIFPYSYVDSAKKLTLPSLPQKFCFYNELMMKDITDEEYQHAHDVWRAFGIKTLGEYQDIYLLADCLQLADTYESFRNVVHDQYGLDVTHYVSLPSFTFDAAIKMCRAKPQLLTELDSYILLESGLRGGINGVTKRFAKANHPACPEYDSKKENIFIQGVDITNSYGFCMTQALPYSEYRWLTQDEIDEFDLMSVDENSDYGFIIVCDLLYPAELHDLHNFMPLAPQKRKIKRSEISNYNHRLSEKFGFRADRSEKLLLDFSKKTNYVVHYRVLQLYSKLGLVIDKINRILTFRQLPWLRSYIEQNTMLRNSATNEFEKSTYKYLINSLFGRLCMNTRRFLDIRVCTKQSQFLKLVKKETYKHTMRLSENLVLCHMTKATVKLRQLVQSAFTVLDLSKIPMYRYYYTNLLPRYPSSSVSLLMYDTDGMIFEVKTQNFFADLKMDDDNFYDFSTLDSSHPLYSRQNEKRLGFFKFEYAKNGHILEFCGIKSKNYSLLFSGDTCICKGKGTPRYILKKLLKHENYVAILKSESYREDNCMLFRSRLHQIETVQTRKITLNPIDFKRWICDNGIDTYAYYHYKTINANKVK